jgi:hypothetical protein
MEFLLYLTPLGKEIINSVMLANYNIRENAPICRNKEIVGYIKSKDFVICTNNIKNNISPVSYYINEAVYHEATHVAQYCKGSKLNVVTYLDKNKEDNVARSLKVSNSSSSYETEAYYLEDKPEKVLHYLKKFCF